MKFSGFFFGLGWKVLWVGENLLGFWGVERRREEQRADTRSFMNMAVWSLRKICPFNAAPLNPKRLFYLILIPPKKKIFTA